MNAKKILLSVLGGIFALLLILALIFTFFVEPQASTASESDYHDPRLEELRERNAELDEVYEGGAEVVDPQQASDGEDPFATRGELSDFDGFADATEPNAAAEPAAETAAPIESTAEQQRDDTRDLTPTTPAAATAERAQNSDLAEQDAGSDNVAPGELESTTQTSPTGSTISERELDMMVDDAVKEAVDAMVDNSELSRLASQNERQQARINETLETLPETIHATVEEALYDREDNAEVRTRLNALAAEVTALKAQREARASRATRPSSSTLRNLYRLDRIQGDVAVLIGQNTGRTYTFAEGDTLAYGGTLSSIRGDSVTLSWPNTRFTMSIY